MLNNYANNKLRVLGGLYKQAEDKGELFSTKSMHFDHNNTAQINGNSIPWNQRSDAKQPISDQAKMDNQMNLQHGMLNGTIGQQPSITQWDNPSNRILTIEDPNDPLNRQPAEDLRVNNGASIPRYSYDYSGPVSRNFGTGEQNGMVSYIGDYSTDKDLNTGYTTTWSQGFGRLNPNSVDPGSILGTLDKTNLLTCSK